jgi:hypothetical protein
LKEFFLLQPNHSTELSGGITAGQFRAMPHLKLKILTQFSVAIKKYF